MGAQYIFRRFLPFLSSINCNSNHVPPSEVVSGGCTWSGQAANVSISIEELTPLESSINGDVFPSLYTFLKDCVINDFNQWDLCRMFKTASLRIIVRNLTGPSVSEKLFIVMFNGFIPHTILPSFMLALSAIHLSQFILVCFQDETPSLWQAHVTSTPWIPVSVHSRVPRRTEGTCSWCSHLLLTQVHSSILLLQWHSATQEAQCLHPPARLLATRAHGIT